MNKEFLQALEEIQKEKGIDKEELIAAIETALISAYKKHYGSDEEIVILIDRNVGDVSVFAQKSVSEKEKDALEENEISLEEAKKIKKDAAVGEIIDVQVNPKDFGRIAAQNAKQLVIQKIKESERNIIYNEFFEKQDELISGLVQRKENNNNIIIDLGKTDGVLNVANQIKGEHYYQGMRLKVYVTEVKKTTKGPHIMLSRNHVGLLRRLLELEVPEIYSGDVEVKSIAREAGSRAKVAVFAENENIDPVGSCVGTRGMRIQNIVNELNGEKIDVIEWNADPVVYITAALSPAGVLRVDLDEENKIAYVVVPNDQLSLAIGKEGQNVRLAARLTGWKIDIKNQEEDENMPAEVLQKRQEEQDLLDSLVEEINNLVE
ncbi:MAG: transcription termination/antitermination protein NusA [Eubacteriaceae bacterium]|mgnify:CR=1 FL=1|jgi:N utilization substance protein A|nr:transcription termination/antitermination protein NusA [Eubacteriaceae bacterium]